MPRMHAGRQASVCAQNGGAQRTQAPQRLVKQQAAVYSTAAGAPQPSHAYIQAATDSNVLARLVDLIAIMYVHYMNIAMHAGRVGVSTGALRTHRI